VSDVVVAHEDSLIRGLITSALEDDGFDVREASSAASAVKLCKEQAPDVVFVDTGLCDGEKRPLVTELKADPSLFSVAVVLITPPRSATQLTRELDRGAQDIVTLPLREADVVARARSAARTKELQTELLGRGRVLEAIAYVDPMTRLYNRRFLTSQISALVASSERHDRDLSIVFVDIDRFKAINDELGHAAGDSAIVEVAGRLRSRSRQEDFIGRWGGEEFMVVLPDVGTDGAHTAAEGLRDAVASMPMVINGHSRDVTISNGYATWKRGETLSQLLERADKALYAAKRSGRNAVRGDSPPGRFRRDDAEGSQETSASSGRLA
jgi:two-component system cell cycle response regulator